MKSIYKIIVCISFLFLTACSLDVIPDNLPTIDHAFNNRASAETYLFTCYSYLPMNQVSRGNNVSLMSGESWMVLNDDNYWFGSHTEAHDIARGLQNSNSPLLNYWDGGEGGSNLFVAIRDCNIFLENIHKAIDLDNYERVRWEAEVKFLKAYYHFFLLRMYGPIPIIETNLPVSANPEEVKVYREPVNDVAAYICELLDEASEELPVKITNEIQEMGRATKPIALALKAKVKMMIASPLFNGNDRYKNLIDNRGVNLFPEYDANRWNEAVSACKEAIDCAHEAGCKLYYYQGYLPLSDTTRYKLNLRYAITEKWNPEIIWGTTINDSDLQGACMIRTRSDETGNMQTIATIAPTLDVVERFYTRRGVPISEDKIWKNNNRYVERYKTEIVGDSEKYLLKDGYTTAKLNFDREYRFYASLIFDGCLIYGNGVTDDKSNSMTYGQMKKKQFGGQLAADSYSITGYTPKKLINPESTVKGTTFTRKRYSFPVIRLADLYLMYAEALNETGAGNSDIFQWIDPVRERSGLEGVEASWSKYSTNPTKINTQEGRRDIIHQERLIELAFEGETHWDILRWCEADDYRNRPIRGWNASGETAEEYYVETFITYPTFTTKDYFTPLKKSSLNVNNNLIQNYGW
ncbi:RagB/SusD family nutrient uptake outer membrane protein [uncultured Parabacteroides sp.]|uniref:RagB/SusD family nutrient uptake outer membrane protein n=1 Tax=uncultured Parabacteroides sp. TaxID=512312 RepID=UPI0025944383|nr:RagB/SusD family nutrient uptake outer membrane protein [uncultured Parabacteroides sp.]